MQIKEIVSIGQEYWLEVRHGPVLLSKKYTRKKGFTLPAPKAQHFSE